MNKFSIIVTTFFSVLCLSALVCGQASTQDFGTGSGSHTSQTGTAAFLPNPTSGTTWARAGATAPNAPIVLANTSNPLGTSGSYVRGVASASTSVSKFSPMVNYTGSTEFYTSFKVLFGDAAGGTTASSGAWSFYQGAGAMYSDANNFSGAQVFTGLTFSYGADGAVNLTYRNGGSASTFGLTQTAFSQGTVYTIEIVGNNKATGTINYVYNGVSRSVAVQKFDLYINGTLIGDDLSEAILPGGTNINSNTFIGVSSVSNAANVFVDDVVTYNAVPGVIASVPTPNLAINDVSQDEGDAGTTAYTFTVNLSSATHGGVIFDIATADGTATVAGGDYAANSLTGQVIPNGSSSYQFTVQVNGDTTVEPNETFFVNITNVTGANVVDGQGAGILVNDDAATPTTVEFDSADFFEDESQTAFVNVSRSGNLSGTTTVDYTTQVMTRGTGGTATGGASCTPGVDFVAQSGTLTFEVEDEFKQIEIQLCGDSEIEPNESFDVFLTNATGGVLGETTTAQVVINDTASEFVNTDQIFIGTSGDANDSSITVSGAPTSIGGLRVTLFDFEHLNADDVDVLLVGPQGEKFLLMADAGGDSGLAEGATVTFDDNAGIVLPDAGQIISGQYEPTTWEPGQADFSAPAPAGPYSEPGSTVGGAVTLASVFGGTNANGTWTLYIRDDNNAFQRLGSDGIVAGGWGLQFLAPTAAGVSVSGQVRSGKTPIANATVMITGGGLTEPLFTRTNSFGNYRFESLAGGQTYVVTVFSARYNFPQSSIVLNLQDSVDGADFEGEEQ